MAPLRAFLAALLLAAGLVLVGPSAPAAACSCASSRIQNQIDARDVVFRGTVESRSQLRDGGFVYAFEVVEVFQGRTTKTTQVRSSSGAAVCGLEGMGVGDDFVVFASVGNDPADGLSTGLCSGTQDATSSVIAQIESITGPGSAPDPGGERIDDDPPVQPWIPYWAMVAIAAGLVGGLGLMLVVMRRIPA